MRRRAVQERGFLRVRVRAQRLDRDAFRELRIDKVGVRDLRFLSKNRLVTRDWVTCYTPASRAVK
jgi:hypothetical protein